MAGESIVVFGTTVNATLSGASLANTVFSTGVDVSAAQLGNHKIADLVFKGTFASAPGAGQYINIYRRDINIKGTDSMPVPDSSFLSIPVGAFLVDAVNASQTLSLTDVPLSPNCEFYIENRSGQTLNAGWSLDVKPWGYGIA